MNGNNKEPINETQHKCVIQHIKNEVLALNQKYIDESDDHYDFWEQHIKYVVDNALYLASKFNADLEVVELGAILHDIALVAKVGTKKDHHINGANLAKELLLKYGYSQNKINLVIGCVLNHRSSKNATNIEELCVADADILAHFDNIEMVLNVARKQCIDSKNIIEWCESDYNDLSENTKSDFKPKYEKFIIEILKRLEDTPSEG